MDELILSQDGSHTVVSKRFGVSYHSKYGAVQETQTVFIDAALKYKEGLGEKSLAILEMGFGTGLNAIMTYIQKSDSTNIDYSTLEAYPLSVAQFSQLNYPEILNLNDQQKNAFLSMHKAKSNQPLKLETDFTFTKYLQKIEDYQTEKRFDIIYYDAFAPTSQEELWTQDMMEKIYSMCNPGAVFVTYCAKGAFKRALRAAGFEVQGLDGPIGKREMTRAIKVTPN